MSSTFEDENELAHQIMASCMAVNLELGAGNAHGIYLKALEAELQMKEYQSKANAPITLIYKQKKIENAANIDLVIEDKIAVDIITSGSITELDKQILANKMKLAQIEYGLLVDFNASRLRKGIKRIIVSQKAPDSMPVKDL